jgi:hypothetical protein
MVWHIFRKDLRLLWVLALVVGAIHLTAAALRSWLGLFEEPRQLETLAALLSLLSFLSVVILSAAVMHQDAIPGVSQDWIVRPIKRGDLILAKLLVVQGPLLLADLGEGMADGFNFLASLGAAAEHNVAILCYLSLPAVMIGAVTRNIMESFMIATVGLIGYVAVFLVGVVLLLGVKTSVGGTGLSWLVAATWYTLAVTGSAVVISLQFFRRKTAMVRCLIGAGGAAIILSAFVPWHAAFALQERLSSEPSSAGAILLAFNPRLGPHRLPPGAAAAAGTGLYLPLRVTGVPSAAVVLMDRANVRLTDIGGRTLYEGRSNLTVDGIGSIEEARVLVSQGASGGAAVDLYQRVFMPAAIYAKLGDRAVRMEIDYSLTLFRPEGTYSMPAAGGSGRLHGLGWCATRIDGEGDDVQLRCLETRRVPYCFTAFLEHTPSGVRNPERHFCEPDYTFFRTNLWPDALSRLEGELPFFDRSGLAHYPVDGAKLADSRLVIRTYQPRDHFTRQLETPVIRLSDFTAAPGGARP